MELVTSWEKEYHAFKEITHRTGSVGNCYFSADSFRSYTFSGRLYKQPMERGICFFLDREKKWDLFLCASEDAEWAIPESKKPIVANFISQNNAMDCISEEKLLLTKGMKSGRILYDCVIGKLTTEKEDEYKTIIERLNESGYQFDLLSPCLFTEAYQILCSCINPFDMVGYEEMNFAQMFSDKNIFCAIDSNEDKLCAVCILPASFRGGLTAVVPEKRGIGLGKALKYYSYHVAKDASKQHLWIAKDNLKNRNLMRQMGAVETGRILRQYVLDEYVN